MWGSLSDFMGFFGVLGGGGGDLLVFLGAYWMGGGLAFSFAGLKACGLNSSYWIGLGKLWVWGWEQEQEQEQG